MSDRALLESAKKQQVRHLGSPGTTKKSMRRSKSSVTRAGDKTSEGGLAGSPHTQASSAQALSSRTQSEGSTDGPEDEYKLDGGNVQISSSAEGSGSPGDSDSDDGRERQNGGGSDSGNGRRGLRGSTSMRGGGDRLLNNLLQLNFSNLTVFLQQMVESMGEQESRVEALEEAVKEEKSKREREVEDLERTVLVQKQKQVKLMGMLSDVVHRVEAVEKEVEHFKIEKKKMENEDVYQAQLNEHAEKMEQLEADQEVYFASAQRTSTQVLKMEEEVEELKESLALAEKRTAQSIENVSLNFAGVERVREMQDKIYDLEKTVNMLDRNDNVRDQIRKRNTVDVWLTKKGDRKASVPQLHSTNSAPVLMGAHDSSTQGDADMDAQQHVAAPGDEAVPGGGARARDDDDDNDNEGSNNSDQGSQEGEESDEGGERVGPVTGTRMHTRADDEAEARAAAAAATAAGEAEAQAAAEVASATDASGEQQQTQHPLQVDTSMTSTQQQQQTERERGQSMGASSPRTGPPSGWASSVPVAKTLGSPTSGVEGGEEGGTSGGGMGGTPTQSNLDRMAARRERLALQRRPSAAELLEVLGDSAVNSKRRSTSPSGASQDSRSTGPSQSGGSSGLSREALSMSKSEIKTYIKETTAHVLSTSNLRSIVVNDHQTVVDMREEMTKTWDRVDRVVKAIKEVRKQMLDLNKQVTTSARPESSSGGSNRPGSRRKERSLSNLSQSVIEEVDERGGGGVGGASGRPSSRGSTTSSRRTPRPGSRGGSASGAGRNSPFADLDRTSPLTRTRSVNDDQERNQVLFNSVLKLQEEIDDVRVGMRNLRESNGLMTGEEEDLPDVDLTSIAMAWGPMANNVNTTMAQMNRQEAHLNTLFRDNQRLAQEVSGLRQTLELLTSGGHVGGGGGGGGQQQQQQQGGGGGGGLQSSPSLTGAAGGKFGLHSAVPEGVDPLSMEETTTAFKYLRDLVVRHAKQIATLTLTKLDRTEFYHEINTKADAKALALKPSREYVDDKLEKMKAFVKERTGDLEDRVASDLDLLQEDLETTQMYFTNLQSNLMMHGAGALKGDDDDDDGDSTYGSAKKRSSKSFQQVCLACNRPLPHEHKVAAPIPVMPRPVNNPTFRPVVNRDLQQRKRRHNMRENVTFRQSRGLDSVPSTEMEEEARKLMIGEPTAGSDEPHSDSGYTLPAMPNHPHNNHPAGGGTGGGGTGRMGFGFDRAGVSTQASGVTPSGDMSEDETGEFLKTGRMHVSERVSPKTVARQPRAVGKKRIVAVGREGPEGDDQADEVVVDYDGDVDESGTGTPGTLGFATDEGTDEMLATGVKMQPQRKEAEGPQQQQPAGQIQGDDDHDEVGEDAQDGEKVEEGGSSTMTQIAAVDDSVVVRPGANGSDGGGGSGASATPSLPRIERTASGSALLNNGTGERKAPAQPQPPQEGAPSAEQAGGRSRKAASEAMSTSQSGDGVLGSNSSSSSNSGTPVGSELDQSRSVSFDEAVSKHLYEPEGGTTASGKGGRQKKRKGKKTGVARR